MASLAPGTYELYKVDIATDDHLVDKYGIFIPVLEQQGEAKGLYWPFDKEKLLDFLCHSQA